MLAALFLAVAAHAQETAPASDSVPTGEVVVVCRVTGMIDPGIAVVIKRALAEAEKSKAAAVVLRIDTPGGRVDSAVEIATALTNSTVRTIAYIEGMGAISAGALISFACDDIIMSPGSAIGAATPVIATAEGMMPTGEKEVSFMRAKMRALAESNGHSPDLAQAMVDKDIELRGIVGEDGKYTMFSVGEVPSYEAEDDSPLAPVKEILRDIAGDALPVEEPKPAETTDAAPATETETEIVGEHAAGTVVYPDGSELISPAGKLLTLTPSEAAKYGLIPMVVNSFQLALAYYGFAAPQIHTIEPNWAEETFRFLTSPTVAGLLLMIGLGALYYEIKTAGLGLAGIVGAIALMLLFGAHFVLGLADTIDIVLIIAGFLLIAVEAFILPGFGIAGVAGIVFVLIGTYLSLVNFTLPRYSWEYDRFSEVLYSLTVAMVTFTIFVVATWRFFPRSPFYRAMTLEATQTTTEGYTAPVQAAAEPRIGLRGTATSTLRPAGRARFGEATLQVVTRGAFIPAGTDVEIIEVDGARIVVEQTGAQA